MCRYLVDEFYALSHLQCLCMIMEAASKKECVQPGSYTGLSSLPPPSTGRVMLLTTVSLPALHLQMCAAATGPNNFKNHNEILRCYAVACQSIPVCNAHPHSLSQARHTLIVLSASY